MPTQGWESLGFLMNIALVPVGMPEVEHCSPTGLLCPGSGLGFPPAEDTGEVLWGWPSWAQTGDIAELIFRAAWGALAGLTVPTVSSGAALQL